VPFSKYPKLETTGGSAQITASSYTDAVCGQHDIIVVNSGGQYVALSSSCTHACCTVSWTGSELHCPCHSATFNLQGKCTNGKASKNLEVLSTCSDSTGVYVTT
jgi:Rieske Fe-S protein